jgi:hypothetical protein
MSGSNGNGVSGDGRHSGPVPGPSLRFLHGTDQCSSTVLPTPNLITEYLDKDDLRKLNVIQLEYAHKVAEAQRDAYERLLSVFGVCPDGRHSGPVP